MCIPTPLINFKVETKQGAVVRVHKASPEGYYDVYVWSNADQMAGSCSARFNCWATAVDYVHHVARQIDGEVAA